MTHRTMSEHSYRGATSRSPARFNSAYYYYNKMFQSESQNVNHVLLFQQ